jgi:hypothetical protein
MPIDIWDSVRNPAGNCPLCPVLSIAVAKVSLDIALNPKSMARKAKE